MAAEINGVFKEDLRKHILSSKLLVVGAGGIGCEILKNLVMCGFKDIEIVSFESINRRKIVNFSDFRSIWTRLTLVT